MGREAGTKPVRILYIGRPDESYDRVWQSLQQDGSTVIFARTQAAGLQAARDHRPNVIVVNPASSHFSGERLCRLLGSRLPGAQRVLIADRSGNAAAECEQRLLRPFTARKLRDTIRKVLETALPHKLQAGPVEVDLAARLVTAPAGTSHLTPKQCALLAIFLRRPNQVISRQELMERIWETDYLGDTRTLDVHVRWLREKVEADPKHPVLLLTRRNVGYILSVPGVAVDAAPDPEDDPD